MSVLPKKKEAIMLLENVKIVSRNNRPIAILKFSTLFNKESVGYYSYNRMRKHIKTFESDGYRYIEMPVGYLYSFISINERICGKESDVVFDKNSLTTFYCYTHGNKELYCSQLTSPIIKTWVAYDCPDLIRYTVNINRKKNWAGLNLLYWSDVIYQDDSYTISVDELTKDEYKAFKKAMNHSWYCWEKINEAWENQHSVQNTDEVLAAVKAYESEVQELINSYQSELEGFKESLEEIPMDCGFTMIYTTNEMINKHISFLKSKGIRTVDYLEVVFPYDYFSVTNSRKIFRHFKEIVGENPLKDELSVRTRFD